MDPDFDRLIQPAHQFYGDSLAAIYSEAITATVAHGNVITPRGKECFELRPVVITTPMTQCGLRRSGTNYRIGVAEFLMTIGGWNDLAFLRHVSPNMQRFSDDGGVTSWGGYGSRVRFPIDQLDHAAKRLRMDIDSRQVCVAFWNPAADLNKPGVYKKDFPCNTHFYMKVRGGRLDLVVMRRSADIIWGLPLDTFLFSLLGRYFAQCVGVECGTLTQFIDSLHLYTPQAGYYDQARVNQARETPTDSHPLWNADYVIEDAVQRRSEEIHLRKHVIDARNYYERVEQTDQLVKWRKAGPMHAVDYPTLRDDWRAQYGVEYLQSWGNPDWAMRMTDLVFMGRTEDWKTSCP